MRRGTKLYLVLISNEGLTRDVEVKGRCSYSGHEMVEGREESKKPAHNHGFLESRPASLRI